MNRFKEKRLNKIGLIVCLSVFAVLSFGTALQESAVFDEPTHIASGFLYWTTGKYFLNPINTPLIRLWATLPLLTMPLQVPTPTPAWVMQNHFSLSDVLFNFNPVSADRILNATRFMIVLLAVGVGWGVWRWSRELFGERAALAAVVAYCFCPPLLAYSHLTTADFGAAAFSFLALYEFWRFEMRPSRSAAFRAGLAMGLNVAAKFTGLYLLPILGVLHVLHRRNKPVNTSPRRKADFYLLLYVIGAALVIVGVYRVTELYRIGQGLEDLRSALTVETSQYFAGRFNVTEPWKWFYAACFVLKTPLPFLILIIAGVGLTLRRRYPHQKPALLWLLFPSAAYLALLSFSTSQPGIRRLIFLYPLLCIWIGGAVSKLIEDSRAGRLACGFLGAWYVLGTLALFPRYFAYFNELVGGPSQGYKYLLDCNLDWGQGLKALGKYLHKEDAGTVYLAYFGGGPPDAYGIRYVWVGPAISSYLMYKQEPELAFRKQKKALLAVSATSLAGIYFGGRDDFAWLRSRTPTARLMDSIFVYDITHDPESHRHLAELFEHFGNHRQARIEREI